MIRIAGVTLKARQTDITPERWELTDVYGTSCEYKAALRRQHAQGHRLPGQAGDRRTAPALYPGHRPAGSPEPELQPRPPHTGHPLAGAGVPAGRGTGSHLGRGNPRGRSHRSHRRPLVLSGIAAGLLPADDPQRGPRRPGAAAYRPAIRAAGAIHARLLRQYPPRRPEGEASDLREPRQSLSIGLFWHQGASAVPTDRTFSKPLEFVAERGGQLGNAGLLAQFRLQNIHEEQGPSATRAVAGASLGLPPLKLSPWLHGLVRFDGAGHVGTGGSYGWARAQIGAVVRPTPWLTLGAAYIGSVEGERRTFPSTASTRRTAITFGATSTWAPPRSATC